MFSGSATRGAAVGLAAAGALVAGANFILITFFSHYYNYGGESLELYALLRMARGLPYLGALGELPAIVNPYGPYPLYALSAPLRFFGLTDPYWANVAAITAALYTKDIRLLGRAVDDRIVEPARAPLIPGFAEVKRRVRDAAGVTLEEEIVIAPER